MPDDSITCIAPDDAAGLAELFTKGFRKTGYSKCAENREELIQWIRNKCKQSKVFAIKDAQGAITLGCYDHEQNKVALIVTREGMETNGYGEKMLNHFANTYQGVSIVPVTDGGIKLTYKCGFHPKGGNECTWIRDY
jgi:hypothetical protein